MTFIGPIDLTHGLAFGSPSNEAMEHHDPGDEDRLCGGPCFVGDQGIVWCSTCDGCTCCPPYNERDHVESVAIAWTNDEQLWLRRASENSEAM